MKIYLVGGCVRDHLLGIKPKDIDYVVVGSTTEEMLSMGFTQVGAAFPVFLKNGEEYALARKERKTGRGYNGFAVEFDPSVTLEEDLIRRDLTINSMAMDIDTGEIIDPYGGQEDLRRGLLRHTSDAFAEDPVRVLRTARFAARYSFVVDERTIQLMSDIVDELHDVPQERIWAEFEKGLMERQPARMYAVLQDCGALTDCGPLAPYASVNMAALSRVCDQDSLAVRFGVVCRGFDRESFIRCRIPAELAHVGTVAQDTIELISEYCYLTKQSRLMLLERLRALHSVFLFAECLRITKLCRPIVDDCAVLAMATIDLQDIRSVDAASIAASYPKKDIPSRIMDARLAAMTQ